MPTKPRTVQNQNPHFCITSPEIPEKAKYLRQHPHSNQKSETLPCPVSFNYSIQRNSLRENYYIPKNLEKYIFNNYNIISRMLVVLNDLNQLLHIGQPTYRTLFPGDEFISIKLLYLLQYCFNFGKLQSDGPHAIFFLSMVKLFTLLC